MSLSSNLVFSNGKRAHDAIVAIEHSDIARKRCSGGGSVCDRKAAQPGSISASNRP